MSDPPTDPNRGTGDDTDERTDPANADPEQGRVDTDEKGRARADSDAIKWVSGVVSLVGLWIAASAFLYETAQTSRWNNVVTGSAIFLLAGYGFYRMSSGDRPDVGSTSLASLLGLWAIAAPFLLAYGSDALVWSTMASGVAVAILSGYNAYESRRAGAPRGSGVRA